MTDAGFREFRRRLELAGCLECPEIKIERGRNRNVYGCHAPAGPELDAAGHCRALEG